MVAEGNSVDDSDASRRRGVERAVALMSLFRERNQIRETAELEAHVGYIEIAKTNSSGKKNFQNDRKTLAGLGLIIESLDDGQWRLTSDPRPVLFAMSEAEKSALVAVGAMAKQAAGDGEDVTAVSHTTVRKGTALLLTAIGDGVWVEFGYPRNRYVVDPKRVVVSPTGKPLLLAVSYTTAGGVETGSARTFRIDRMRDVRVDRDWVSRPVPAGCEWPLHPSSWSLDDQVQVTVRFPHYPPTEWLAMLGSMTSEIMTDDDDSVHATFEVANHQAFVRRIVAIGATITSPSALVGLADDLVRQHALRFGVN